MEYSKKVAEALLNIKAVKLQPKDPFTWSSGMRSPIYCDNRIVLSYPQYRNLIVNGLVDMVESGQYFQSLPDYIAGVATAGIPHGALLADRLNLPFVYVRSKPKTHGRKHQIEGFLKKNANVLVIEDLISTGGSSLQAVDVLKAVDANVLGVLAIFTYGFKEASDNFARANCPVATLSDYHTLVEVANMNGYLQEDEVKTLMKWRENPKEWWEGN